MSETRYRVAASCGVGFTALMVAATSVVPTAPEYNSGAAAIRDYLTAHRAELGLSTLLTAAAALLLIPFFGFVIGRLQTSDPDDGPLSATFQLAAAAVATSLLFATIFEAALAQRIAATADNSTLQALYAVWLLAFHTAPSMAMIVALLCAAVAIVRWHLFPFWLAVAATLAAALTLLDSVSDLATSGTSLGPVGLIAFASVNVWIVGTALTGIRARTTRHNPVTYPQAEPGAS